VKMRWNNIKKCVLDAVEWFGWESRQESEKAMNYTRND
jgi:hypothetical protein